MERRALEQLSTQSSGFITYAQVIAAGLDPHALRAGVDAGWLERVQRGVYRLSNAGIQPFEAMLELQLRLPYAVISGSSALAVHGLTTFMPKIIEVSVPRNKHPPRLEYPRMTVSYLASAAYLHGQQTMDLGGASLTVYTMERTLADLLRESKRAGSTLFAEGFKAYLQRGPPKVRALLEAARVRRLEPAMRDLLEMIA